MSLIMPPKGQEFTPCPAGNHFATCYQVIDLGTQLTNFQGQTKQKHQFTVGWEMPEVPMDDGRPFTTKKTYTLSSHEKATLRKDLESWRGRAFSDAELGSFDIGKLIGANCFLNIVHEEKDGKTYTKIASIAALPKGLNLQMTRQTTNPPVYFSLSAFDQAVFDGLTDYVKGKIMLSPEYQHLKGGHPSDQIPPSEDSVPMLNDEIPF